MSNPKNMKAIYDKYRTGELITDSELRTAIPFFEHLASDLLQCGPVFILAWREAHNIYCTLSEYATARNLKL